MIWQFGSSCHITNNGTGLYDVAKINELVQGNSDYVSTTKKGKIDLKVNQVDGSEPVHILWPMKYCARAGANSIFFACYS